MNLTDMMNVLSFDIFIVRFLHTTTNATALVLSKKKHFADENNEHTMLMRNTYKEKHFKLALFKSILVTVPVDMHFITRLFPIFLWLILVMETLVAYITFGLRWIKTKVFVYRHTLFVVT